MTQQTPKLFTFLNIDLIGYNESENMGTGVAPTSYFRLPGGGSIDNFGTQKTYPGSMTRNKNLVFAQPTNESLNIEVNSLKKLRGTRAKLFRYDVEGKKQFVWARLEQVGIIRTTDEGRNILNKTQSAVLMFACESDEWQGAFQGAWLINDGNFINAGLEINSGLSFTLTSSPETIQVEIEENSIESNINTRSVKMTITPVSSMSSFKIENDETGEILEFAGTVDAGDSLVIDSGNNTVLNDDVDAYNDLTITPGDEPTTWFSVIVGINDLEITQNSGGNVDIDFALREFHI